MNAVAKIQQYEVQAPQSECRASICDYPHGIHDMPDHIYHERILGVANKGALDQIAKTPAHYLAWVNSSDSFDTPAMRFGRAAHAAILEPELFNATYAERPEFGDLRTNAGKAKRDAWVADFPGVQTIDVGDWLKLQGMKSAIAAHPIAGKLFAGGKAEQTVVWEDEETGLLCKSRMDYWRADIHCIVDLKTTEDASPQGFAKSVAGYRYDVQADHYSDGIEVLTSKRPAFLFVAVEKLPPYAVAVYQLDQDAATRGYERRSRDMAALAGCIKTDAWPSYQEGITPLSLPAWALKDYV